MEPFSTLAKEWEPIGLELRRVGKAQRSDILDPWRVASELGLLVPDCGPVLRDLPDSHYSHLCVEGKDMWSGGVHPISMPDGTLLCLLNPFHSKLRHKSTLMEEASHVYLDHETSAVQCLGDGLRFRDYNKTQEKEAFGVGATALLPWDSLFRAINAYKTIVQIANAFKVTKELVEYRIKITGATRLYNARQKSGKSL